MKEISNWSIAGYFIGILLIIASVVRYFIIWVDYSNGAIFFCLGAFICGFSWVYNAISVLKRQDLMRHNLLEQRNDNKFLKLENETLALGDKIADLNELYWDRMNKGNE